MVTRPSRLSVCVSFLQMLLLTAAGVAGAPGHLAAEGKRRGVDSATTRLPVMEASRAEDCSRSRLNAFKNFDLQNVIYKVPSEPHMISLLCLF